MLKNDMKTVLGFDFGMKHIGVAIGQIITHTAKPLTSIKAQDGVPNWDEVHNLILDWRPDALIVGIPLNMDGTEQPMTHCARRFKDRLQEKTKLKVFEVDERLSSYEAMDRLQIQTKHSGKAIHERSQLSPKKRKQVIADLNAMAAAVLVEQWLQDPSNSPAHK